MNESDLTPLSGCRLLITGATGLIGSALVETLMRYAREGEYSVYAVGRNASRAKRLFSEYGKAANFHFLHCDITEDLPLETEFHYILHLAGGASPNVMTRTPVDVMKANITGTDKLLNYGRTHGMRRFLFVSSGEIYGEGDGRVFTESDSGYVDSMQPRSSYPSSKSAAETLCASYAAQYGVDVVVARPCHVYGSGFTENDNRAYAQFFRNVLAGEDIVLKSDGSQYRSWLYVEDCVRALLCILLKGKSGEAYNVADENACLTIRELAETIARAAGRKVVFDLPASGESSQAAKITKAVFSTDKLRHLGWQPLYGISDAVERILAQLSRRGSN